jgi:putative ABC transport system ATP-binding protein
MAAYARRMVHFVDGRIVKDEANTHPTIETPAAARLAAAFEGT